MRWSLQKQSVLLGIITHGEALVFLVLSNSTSERDADVKGDVFSPRELINNLISWTKTLRHIKTLSSFIGVNWTEGLYHKVMHLYICSETNRLPKHCYPRTLNLLNKMILKCMMRFKIQNNKQYVSTQKWRLFHAQNI